MGYDSFCYCLHSYLHCEYAPELFPYIKLFLDNADEMATEEIDVEGLSDILSNDSSGYGVDDEKIENLDKYLGNVEVIERDILYRHLQDERMQVELFRRAIEEGSYGRK